MDADTRWWSLPSTRRFLDRVITDIKNGRNVVVRAPEGTASPRQAFEQAVRAHDSLRFRHVDARGIEMPLSVSLFATLRCKRDPDQIPTAATLAARLPDGDVVFVDGLTAATWHPWWEFAKLYQHGCNSRPEHRRAVFCFLVPGVLEEEPREDATLVVREFRNHFTRLDAMLFVEQLLPEDRSTRTVRQLAVSLAAELAGTDVHLATALARRGGSLIHEPLQIVAMAAQGVPWGKEDVKRSDWCCPWIESYDGRSRLRSTALHVVGDLASLQRRVWHGQIQVLYPFIEEQRIRHLDRVRDWLTLPVQTAFGVVENAHDLEIGPMVHVLRNSRLPQPTWDALQVLKGFRGDLAHMSPVAPHLLKSAAFVSMCRDQDEGS